MEIGFALPWQKRRTNDRKHKYEVLSLIESFICLYIGTMHIVNLLNELDTNYEAKICIEKCWHVALYNRPICIDWHSPKNATLYPK